MARVAWVTGAGGLIGSHLVRTAAQFAPEITIQALTRGKLDLCDAAAVEQAFHRDAPEVVIHCAAMSKSPACQADPALAWRINFEATEHLAQLATRVQF